MSQGLDFLKNLQANDGKENPWFIRRRGGKVVEIAQGYLNLRIDPG